MPLFFMNIRNAAGFVLDDEGQELPDLDAARAEAIGGIRSVLAEEVRAGVLNLHGQIEIRDADDALLAVVPYSEALQLILDGEPR
jgi:hypothetical protein